MAPPKGPSPETQGAIHALPCPWCGRLNDMRDEADGMGRVDVLQPGNVYQCDHCKRHMQIKSVQTAVIVKAKPCGQPGGW